MAAAVVRASIANGAGPTLATAEGGIKFNLADNATDSTTPITIPIATGTVFSWLKALVLEVTTVGTTAITNRNIYLAGAITTGMWMYFLNQATYRQAGSGNRAGSTGSNASVPATYTLLTTSPQLWDNTSVATTSAIKNGNYVEVVLGIDFLYVAGAGSAIALPNILLQYDEA